MEVKILELMEFSEVLIIMHKVPFTRYSMEIASFTFYLDTFSDEIFIIFKKKFFLREKECE